MTAPTAENKSLWRPTAVGTWVISRSDIEAAGGSRKVTMPNSTLRIADFEWDAMKDVEGKVFAWRRSINGTRCFILNNSLTEDHMGKKSKRDHGTATEPKPVSYTLPEPAAEAPKAEAKVAKVPKAINYAAEGEVKATKAGSKLSVLIDRLGQEGGTTFAELAEALSASGSKVDVAGVRSWISYDLRRVGLGCRETDGRLYLVGTPLPHKVAEPKKGPEATAAEPKLQIVKRAAGSAKPKKAKATK